MHKYYVINDVNNYLIAILGKTSMINFVIENDWKWNHCRLPIKRTEKHTKRRDQQYFYQVINSEDTGPINQDKIKINLDRPFPFEPQTGFVWHKSWNLPEITVSINQEEMCFLVEQYKEIKCQLMAVYPIKYSNSYYLNQISLEGSCLKAIHQNPIVFKFLKFGETSFNHNRNKFCLLAWVYGQNAYKDKDDLFCLISSPIYVDSRKQARKDPQSSTAPIIHSPNKFIASIRGMKGSISNSAEGFISYYSAQNIRNKIKHPFYIAYHFDRLFKLFVNNQFKLSLPEALNMIQNSKTTTEGGPSDKNVILIQILDQNEKNRKKIQSIVQKWKFGLIQYTFQEALTTQPKWIPITKQQIKLSYKIHYQNEVIKEEQDKKQMNPIQNRVDENNRMGNRKSSENSQEKRNEVQKQKNYELRTIIELSRPKKKVKLEQQ